MAQTKAEGESMPRYLTVHQMADMLRCCTQTVRNWSRRGLLPRPLAVGRRKRLWDAGQVRQALDALKDRAGR